jgi:hypothetical protein
MQELERQQRIELLERKARRCAEGGDSEGALRWKRKARRLKGE